MRSLSQRNLVGLGERAPDFDLGDAQRLSDLRGSPVVLAFHPSHWDPARVEHVEIYNRLVADLAGIASTRLVSIGKGGTWRDLTFVTDDRLRVPIVHTNSAEAREIFGVANTPATFVIDAGGVVRWRQVGGGRELPSTIELARALSALARSVGQGREPGARRPAPESEVALWNRRQFVATTLAAAFILAMAPTLSRAESIVDANAGAGRGAPRPVTLNVNGRDVTLSLEPRVTLLDALREYAGLTGSKKGCDHGQCGACTVHVDGRRELSCLTFAVMQQGRKITTIEGLASESATDDAIGGLHPMQQAFIAHDGFQCGYCTSGQIMSAVGMLREPWGPGADDVREAMSGNICRCGAYPGIVAAIQEIRHQPVPDGDTR